jgi:Tfp pilus assembly protein PilX
MKKLRQLLDSPAEDRGATLILVLFIVTVIGLAGAALLTFSDTSIRTTVALRDQAAAAYAADGAAQVAINNLSEGVGYGGALFTNATDKTCFGDNATSGTLNLPGFYPAASGQNPTAATSASVTCAADPETGVNGTTTVPVNTGNRPRQSILTLGQGEGGEDGIHVNILAGILNPQWGAFPVGGMVNSNSNINVVRGMLTSTGAATAHSGCTGSIVSTPAKNCSAATIADPNYQSEPTIEAPANTEPAVPPYQPVPLNISASCPDGVVTFKQGYYDDAAALTDLMDGNGACGRSTWWFTPGTYYFDFHNNTRDADANRGLTTGGDGSADRWAITAGNLVAGTPVDSNGTPIASPSSSPTIPGSCQNPSKAATAQKGVQFIFGGDSQLALGGSADGEICGTYHRNQPPIALYGVKSGTASTTTATGTGSGTGAALKMSTVTSAGNFTNATNVTEEDSTSATWPKTGSTSESSTITVSGYGPPVAIPKGSIVKSASVRVRHGNSGTYVNGPGGDQVTVTVTPKGVTGSPPSTPITITPTLGTTSTGLVSDPPVDIYSGGTSDFDKDVHDNGFTGADMAYAATLTHDGTESLDSIQIDIAYVVPAFRAENISTIGSNCMTQPYTTSYPDTSSGTSACAVLSTSALPLHIWWGAFYLQGTTYTPLAAIDLTLNVWQKQVLSFGVISRTLWVSGLLAFNFTGPLITVPDLSPTGSSAPVVFLTVYVCPGITTPSCSTHPDAITALRAKAVIAGSAPPSAMTILSWSTLR